ncbi:MAG: YraN family protein [Bacteroidales bacterium]|nr:YraN family protein [Bacteroidales bacterium]
MGSDRSEIGRKGEDVALGFLKRRGMNLVARNWRSGHKELDLIMEDDSFLRIVEVKSLSYPNDTNPFEAVGWQKRRRMIAAAQHFAAFKSIEKEIVFDVVSVVFNGDICKVEYFPEAFSPVL